MQHTDEFDCNVLVHVQKQFFNLIPVSALDFSQVVLNVDSEESIKRQNVLLNLTVKHPLVQKFPLKFEYQKSFLKCLVGKIESSGLEVAEELYTTYCDLLSTRVNDKETHFRHYILYDSKSIILKESSSLISQGTTGLCSWQASLALAEWCLSHRDLFSNKHVLELGAGAGLTGLTVSLCCQPKSYWFTDCHPAVLNLLQFNVGLNVSLCDAADCASASEVTSKDEYNSKILFQSKLKETDVYVIDLPWEEVESCNVTTSVKPDIILAADVVYDESTFPQLISTLKYFLNVKESSQCLVLLACTVRDSKTTQNFLNQLNSENLEFCEKKLEKTDIFVYSTDLPIKLFQINTASTH